MPDDGRKMDKFTFFLSYYEAARELPEKQRLALYDAITQYIFDDAEPELSGIANSMWGLIMPYLRKSKVNSQSGAEGGKASVQAKSKQSSKRTASAEVSECQANDEANCKRGVKRNSSETPSEPDSETSSNKKLEVRNRCLNGEREEETLPPTPSGGVDGAESPAPEPDPFERFWEAYPRKESKGAARKAWAKIKPGKALFEKILLAVAFAKTSEQWLREDGRYIPHPTTWLNQGRWDDELKQGGAAPPLPHPSGGKVNTMDVLSRIVAESEGGEP